ncbi:MAG: type II secretion system protein GspD [Halobacteriovorax sp.]|nr:type II secretion system protein GspD [Halobacteriovorax sp.]
MANLFKFFALPLALSLAIPSASAQFDQYRSRTNFNNDGANGSAKDFIQGQTKANDKDDFGRESGAPAPTGPEASKYVQLNPETSFGPEVVTSFEFKDVSLVDLTKHMQKLTGINLILDKDLKGKITISAPQAITVGDAWKAYLTALNVNGYTLVKAGAFWKVVNSRDIRYTPTKMYTGNYTPDTENYVMRIIPLKNISVTEVTRSFRPFMTRYGRLIDIKQTNTLIVQDTGENINRLVRLIKFIDVPGHEESLQIIPVRNSSAQEIAKLLDQILKSNTTGTAAARRRTQAPDQQENISKIIAEPRTNSIIAMANAEGARQLRELILKLDVKGLSNTGGQIHVYYLNYGDAETLAKTLSTLVQTASTPAAGGAAGTRASRFSGSNDSDTLFNNPVKITADKDNNALVVTAAPTDYLTVKDVIKKLDIPRDQVYVEGMIMETQVNREKGFGISILGAYGSGGAQRAGFTGGSSDLVNLLAGNITSLGGLFAGAGIGNKIEYTPPGGSAIEINSVNALITAIARNGNTNVLATPQILALDNTDAVFEVGESVPTVERTNTNGTITTSTKQQKVALTLKITPQINKVTRFVKLKIDQKIQDFSNRPLPEGLANEGVATTERSAVTTVVVRDRDTIAMGGLMRDREESSVSKVPLLGDIPVLGWLFKNSRTSTSKVNLLLFLTPRIMSPYQKSVANTTKDVLARRNAHLKEALGEEDPYRTTVKGLYEKAEKQGGGPLYDLDDAKRYQQQNEGPGVGADEKVEDLIFESDSAELELPAYEQIQQEVQVIKSGAAAPVRE